MKDPVSGVFRVADWYYNHAHGSGMAKTLTGVLVVDGLPVTPAEVPADNSKWQSQEELPIILDRADPSNFFVQWDQVVKNDWAEVARQRATEAAQRMATGQQAPFGAASGTSFQPGSFTVADMNMGADVNMGDISQEFGDMLRRVGVDPAALMNAGHTEIHVQTSFGRLGQTEPATGVVRAVHDVAAPMPLPPGMSQVDLALDVTRSDGTTYPVTTRIGFRTPQRRAAVAVPGNQVPVLVDPANPGSVVIDVARLNLP
jgi:hypothetical protein